MRQPVTLDIRALWKQMDAEPDKGVNYSRRVLTNEEEWFLWEMWPRKTQKSIGRALGMCADTAKEHYLKLKAAGGPKGKKPEYMA